MKADLRPGGRNLSVIEEEEGKGPSSSTGNFNSISLLNFMYTPVIGDDADEEEEEGSPGENYEKSVPAKEQEVNIEETSSNMNGDTKLDNGEETTRVGVELLVKRQTIKENGSDLKGDDGKRRVERSQQWFYQVNSDHLS